MKTDKTPAIFLRGRRSPYHNLSTRIPASFHVFLDGVPFLYFRESARVQSFKCCIVLTRAQMEIHHVLFTASKKHYTLPPVPQRRRPAPGVFFGTFLFQIRHYFSKWIWNIIMFQKSEQKTFEFQRKIFGNYSFSGIIVGNAYKNHISSTISEILESDFIFIF